MLRQWTLHKVLTGQHKLYNGKSWGWIYQDFFYSSELPQIFEPNTDERRSTAYSSICNTNHDCICIVHVVRSLNC